jgi:hydrogenase maturation protease
VLSDDRVGLAVIERLEAILRATPHEDVHLTISTRGGFDLLDKLSRFERAILVDCIQTDNPRPGTVHHLRMEEISGCARLVNAHEISLPEVFRLAQILRIPMPSELEIFAVEGQDICTLSERMTPQVESAVEPLAREIFGGLVSYST